jgi:hypothetical protein
LIQQKTFDNDLVKCLQSIQAKLLIASFDSDWLFPKEYGLDLQMSAIKQVSIVPTLNLMAITVMTAFSFILISMLQR